MNSINKEKLKEASEVLEVLYQSRYNSICSTLKNHAALRICDIGRLLDRNLTTLLKELRYLVSTGFLRVNDKGYYSLKYFYYEGRVEHINKVLK